MKIRVTICDDEPRVIESIINYLQKYAKENNVDFNIVSFNNGKDLLQNNPNTDIYFLDIQMGSLSGIDIARQLRQKENNALIIFITAMTQYALECYEVHAFGFIPKPLDYNFFASQLSDAINLLIQKKGSTFVINYGNSVTTVNLADIVYFESYGHSIFVSLINLAKPIPCSSSLHSLETELTKNNFFRCHNSYLVNLKCIKKIDQASIMMLNEKTIPLSKYKRKALLQTYAKYHEVF